MKTDPPNSECDHYVTQGRVGSESSWCTTCGVEVMAVHDRPCGECRHFSLDPGARALGGCRAKSMAVTRDMRVNYYVEGIADEWAGRPGLCFEEREAEEPTTGTPAVNPPRGPL